MDIRSAIGHQPARVQNSHQQQGKPEKPEKVSADSQFADSEKIRGDSEQTAKVSGASDKAQAHGVLRKIESDHFSPVAEMRLRMNFHAQIEVRSQQAAMNYLETESVSLIQDIEGELSLIGEEFNFQNQIQGFFDQFEDAVMAMFNNDESSETPGGILGGVREGFAQLFSALEGLSGVGGPEESEEPVLAADAPDEIMPPESTDNDLVLSTEQPADGETPFMSALSDFHSWFDGRIEAMQNAVNEMLNKQPSFDQSRHVVAYTRSLAMYQEISMSTGGTDLGVTDERTVDSQA